MQAPETLLEAVTYFSNPENAFEFFKQIRWPKGVRCPRCGSDKVTFLENAKVWKCRTPHPKQKFSAKVGTIFEDSPIGLDKWLPAMWLTSNCKNGISSYELHRALGVTQKTAWFMLQRIRLAMQQGFGGKMSERVKRMRPTSALRLATCTRIGALALVTRALRKPPCKASCNAQTAIRSRASC
ncbi:MAG: hypothetical protein QOF24_2666 [Verrucomicrobiota bacterium]|jgi:transposase-like protein